LRLNGAPGVDTAQYIGPNNDERVLTYKAGRTKLLAAKDVEKAARTNDNYAYFAMSKWMEKNLGTYPPYPKMWDNKKSRKENEDNEKNEPGASSVDPESLELEDSAQGDVETKNEPYPKEDYPEWYWPVLENLDKPEIPILDVPEWERPLLQVTPDRDAGHWVTDEFSPNIDDCYDVLGRLYDSMTKTPSLAGGEGWEWSGVSQAPYISQSIE
jgi:hypothetical protein